jgi:hypothetical protein
MKKCSICKEIKEEKHFSFQNKQLNKLMSGCKKCTSNLQKEKRQNNIESQRIKDNQYYQQTKEKRVKYAREYRKNYPERTRATNWKVKYGILPEHFYKKLKEQNNCCSICERNMDEYGKIFCVDHNHKTGQIRGLLCDPCNYGLGFYEKHKEKYIEYLSKF